MTTPAARSRVIEGPSSAILSHKRSCRVAMRLLGLLVPWWIDGGHVYG